MKEMSSSTYAELFAGCGGLSLGTAGKDSSVKSWSEEIQEIGER